MLVEGTRFKELYDAVNNEKHQSDDKSILVFVSHSNVDAIGAVRQLQSILQTDESPFCLNPVGSFEEIKQACASIKDTQELRTIICINCGATANLRAVCGIEHNENIRLIILDSHRPIWHGYNDADHNTLVLLDQDDPVPASHAPVYQELDDELRLGEDIYLRQLAAREGSEDDAEDSEASPSAPKRRRTTLSLEAKQRREELLRYYSEKTGFGKPSSLLLYDLARNLGLQQTQHLWLACLGLTDQLVHQRISKRDYELWKRLLDGDIHQENIAQQDINNSQRYDKLTVVKHKDMRLGLLRSWTLLDTLTYTPYCASRLQTWSEKGKGNVKLLLAKMNVPLREGEAPYKAMKNKYREMLPQALNKHGPDFGINMAQLLVDGFELKYKSDVQLSASDMVLMMTMMLGRPTADSTEAKMGFHDAAEILDVERNVAKLKAATERVQHINKAIVEQGGIALQRKQVQGGKTAKFWYINMSQMDLTYKHDFQHPAALHHLAIFLRDAMSRKLGVNKPMVVVGPPGNDDNCYVVALRARETTKSLQNNPFARPFEEVVDSLGIHVKKSSFDSTLYLIHSADGLPFLEELKLVIDRYSKVQQDGGRGEELGGLAGDGQ